MKFVVVACLLLLFGCQSVPDQVLEWNYNFSGLPVEKNAQLYIRCEREARKKNISTDEYIYYCLKGAYNEDAD